MPICAASRSSKSVVVSTFLSNPLLILPSFFVTDARYIGCYQDVAGQSDFATLLWSRTSNNSASTCITDCLRRANMYAAMQNGTNCYCGNSFGRYGQVPYNQCRGRCTETLNEDCGGSLTNAVYATGVGSVSMFTLRPLRNSPFSSIIGHWS